MVWVSLLQTLAARFAGLQRALATVTPDQKNYARVLAWTARRRDDYALHASQLAAWLS